MKVHRILLSGGTGSRLAAAEPKQFLILGSKPVIRHSADTLEQWPVPGRLICAAPSEYVEKTQSILSGSWRVVSGGVSRHSSTLKSLEALGQTDDDDLILIHDAARPLITEAEVQRLRLAMEANPHILIGSLVGLVHDTIVRAKDAGSRSAGIVPREELRSVKTPQVLRASALPALARHTADYTDLLSWAAEADLDALLVECDQANIKMTTAADLRILEALAGQA